MRSIHISNSKQYCFSVINAPGKQLSLSQYSLRKVWMIAKGNIYTNSNDPEPWNKTKQCRHFWYSLETRNYVIFQSACGRLNHNPQLLPPFPHQRNECSPSSPHPAVGLAEHSRGQNMSPPQPGLHHMACFGQWHGSRCTQVLWPALQVSTSSPAPGVHPEGLPAGPTSACVLEWEVSGEPQPEAGPSHHHLQPPCNTGRNNPFSL